MNDRFAHLSFGPGRSRSFELKEIRIIVASPRPVQRSRLAKALATHPAMTIIAQATDLSETYTMAEKLEPDVVLLAEEYARLPEFACMRLQFLAIKASWLVINAPETGQPSLRPPDPSFPAIDAQMAVNEIVARIETVLAAGRGAWPPVATAVGLLPSPASGAMRAERIVLIGASTGGVDALLTLLSNFPIDCPPTAIVQHTGRGYSDSLIGLLDRRCAPRVVAAEDGIRLQTGTVCVAGGSDGHLRLLTAASLRCQISPGLPVSGHVPSVDELFRSALPIADRVTAVLLTGMGRDGAEGLLALRRNGATTIGQDEASAVVYGMPKAAQELGAVQTQLSLNRIGPEILRHCMPASRLAAR